MMGMLEGQQAGERKRYENKENDTLDEKGFFGVDVSSQKGWRRVMKNE